MTKRLDHIYNDTAINTAFNIYSNYFEFPKTVDIDIKKTINKSHLNLIYEQPTIANMFKPYYFFNIKDIIANDNTYLECLHEATYKMLYYSNYTYTYNFEDYNITTFNNQRDIKDMDQIEQSNQNQHEQRKINGVPADFVNSFGNYLGLKYFLTGIEQEQDVFTYIGKIISKEDFEIIKSCYKSCRYINNVTTIQYEFYDENFGYTVIEQNLAEKNRYKILCGIGYSEYNKIIESAGKNIKTEPMASWVTGIDPHGDLEIKNFSIKDIHEYNHQFYPFMKGEDIKDFADRYMNSGSSILLLIGPPGTAKTNFIRQLLSSTNESVLLTYSEDLKKADKLFSYFYDSPEKFLIVEDADTYIERREDGNRNCAQLLNVTDGLTANPDKLVIFSTNLPSLNRVDPALIRPGRCFGVLQFDRLKGDDLDAAIDVIGRNKFEGMKHNDNGYTIAELFSIANGEYGGEQLDFENKKLTSKFGFNN